MPHAFASRMSNDSVSYAHDQFETSTLHNSAHENDAYLGTLDRKFDLPSSFQAKRDMRRNLYVLGIPTEFAQDELAGLFAPYGGVEHAVIMATLDQFNRRRGFIVMGTHEQATAAIRALTGVVVKGHQLHVSFSVVQRSEGFLDGGDRAPRRRRQSSSPILPLSPALSSSPPPLPPSLPCATLVALNLCPRALPRATDVHALFARVGPVRAVRLALGAPGTAVVAFEAPADAAAALELLDGIQVGAFVVRLMSAQL